MDCRIGYVNLHVRDLERSLAFYRDTLGFALMYHEPKFHYAAFDVGGMRFAIAETDKDPFTDTPVGNRMTGVGLVVEDLDEAYRELSAKGVRFPLEPGRQPWGGYMGIFSDPEGNLFYLDQKSGEEAS